MDNKKIVLWIVIAVLFLTLMFMTFKTGNVVSTGSAIKSASSYGGMVGGC